MKNQYPEKFIEEVIGKTKNKVLNPHIAIVPQPALHDVPITNTISIPYCPEVFHKIKKILAPAGVRVAGKSAFSTSGLFTRLKDVVPRKFESNVCYEIICDCGKKYIGQTSQHMQARFSQHQQRHHTSALAAHITDENCSISFDNMKLLCRENNRRARETKEAILIKQNITINTQHDNFDIGHQYDHLIA